MPQARPRRRSMDDVRGAAHLRVDHRRIHVTLAAAGADICALVAVLLFINAYYEIVVL